MALVLVTRPKSSSESFAEELKRYGYDAAVEPLLTITPLATPMPDALDIQAVMITSGNALDILAGRDVAALFDLPCFCVGPRSAARAKGLGFRDVRHSASDGAELAKLIGDSLKDRGRAVLHPCGKDVDSKAQGVLAQSGLKIALWPIYSAVPVEALTKETIGLLREGKLDVITVFSPRTAETLKALLARNQLEACCAGLTAIGLSEAVAGALRSLSWRQLVFAAQPMEAAVIERLKQIHPVS